MKKHVKVKPWQLVLFVVLCAAALFAVAYFAFADGYALGKEHAGRMACYICESDKYGWLIP